jgi:hypothetical protein
MFRTPRPVGHVDVNVNVIVSTVIPWVIKSNAVIDASVDAAALSAFATREHAQR